MQDRLFRESWWRVPQERPALYFELLQRGNRIPFDEHRGAPASRVVAGVRLTFEQQDISHAPLAQEVRERRASDAAADDDDFEVSLWRWHARRP